MEWGGIAIVYMSVLGHFCFSPLLRSERQAGQFVSKAQSVDLLAESTNTETSERQYAGTRTHLHT